ncbi:MAG: restriction endonuclease subunit S [Candidatus Aenigmatarchaeota archaeon]
MEDLLTGKFRLVPLGEIQKEEDPNRSAPRGDNNTYQINANRSDPKIDNTSSHSEQSKVSQPLNSLEHNQFVVNGEVFVGVPNKKWKDSPIGKIPEDWEIKRLGEVSYITMGQSPNSSLVNHDEKGIPFLQGNAEFTFKYPNPSNWIVKPLRIAKESSILVSVRAPVGAFNIANRTFCIGRGLSSVMANYHSVNPLFLWFELNFSVKRIVNLSQGSTFEAIRLKDLKELLLPLPPIPEQQRIASVLSQVDEVIEKEQAYKEKLERMKKGMMEDLLTGKVRVNSLIKEG